jgi:cell division transport system ATP-binding protein
MEMNDLPLVHIENGGVTIAEHAVLQDVNLTIGAGELVYLIGKTGSGKSSLLKCLYGERALSHGQGTVCGHDLNTINRKNVHTLRRDLGIVFQDFALLPDRSASDNLDFVLGATGWSKGTARESRIQACLDAVGLGTKGYKMPYALSGGEQQRLAIARALLNEPPLLIADEPTGNLDPETTNGILQLLHDLVQKDRTVIMATHDHHALQAYPGRVLHCSGGLIEETTNVPS